MRKLLLHSLCLTQILELFACSQSYPLKQEGSAEIFGNYPIIAHQGQKVSYRDDAEEKEVLELTLEPGQQDIVIQYGSFSSNYHCEFQFIAKANQRYEIVDHKRDTPSLYMNGAESIGFGRLVKSLFNQQTVSRIPAKPLQLIAALGHVPDGAALAKQQWL